MRGASPLLRAAASWVAPRAFSGYVLPGRQMAAIQSSVAAPLLEREVELEALADLIERARGGRGGIALLEGPAGIGKTALLERGLQLGRADGARVALARGGELERDLPWAVLRDLFERLF